MKCTEWSNFTNLQNADGVDMVSVSTNLGALFPKSSSDHKLLCDLRQISSPGELSFLTLEMRTVKEMRSTF